MRYKTASSGCNERCIWGQNPLECHTRNCLEPELIFPEICDILIPPPVKKPNQNRNNLN